METYETFKTRNANWDNCGFCTEKDMQRNYEIALQVEKTYNETFVNTNEPQIGDIVEFFDGFRVYDHAKIVENLYGGSEYGMLCVCECGSSFTNGKGFSTSGGAFKAIHKSKFQYVGEDTNIVWTWGCFGAGGNQGIYFPLKVRKWIIPYEPVKCRSFLTIRGKNSKYPAVSIENVSDFFCAESFCSIKAFKAWANYVGYKHHSFGYGTFSQKSPQRICDKCYTDPAWKVPEGAKPIKVIRNGDLKDAWVVTTDETITYYWPNIYNPTKKAPQYGTPEYEKEFEERRKYDGNPLGI